MEGQDFIFWNWPVVLYLLVAGVSAGAFAVSALAYFIDRHKYQEIVRIGAYIAPFPVILGLLCLIFDLKKPALFWKLMVTFQPLSVMSLGAWLLAIFSVLSFLYFYLWLPERWDLTDRLKKFLVRWDKIQFIANIRTSPLLGKFHKRNIDHLKGPIAMAGLVVSLMVGIYTGLLLGVLLARPFWNNPVLPLLFLVSALKTGTASILLFGFLAWSRIGFEYPVSTRGKNLLQAIDAVLIALALIAVALFVFGLYFSPHGQAAAGLILGGRYTFMFWVLAVGVGIILPLAVIAYERVPSIHRLVSLRDGAWLTGLLTPVLVLTGGFFLRYVIVYAGQVILPIS